MYVVNYLPLIMAIASLRLMPYVAQSELITSSALIFVFSDNGEMILTSWVGVDQLLNSLIVGRLVNAAIAFMLYSLMSG
jgi:hypothetical protein